jgi:hypothetical protein
MLRITTITILIAVMISVAGCSGGQTTIGSSRGSSTGVPTQWEYSELGKSVVGGLGIAYEYYYDASEQQIVGSSWKELAGKMGIKKQAATRMDILNHLGDLGWEMLSYETSVNGRQDGLIHSTDYCWVFKRPRH